MLENLGQWYLEAGIPAEDAMLRFRRNGIEAWAKQATRLQAVETVRLYRNRRPVSSEFRAQFVGTFVSADSSFRTKDNDNELRVLAGAASVSMLGASDSGRADTVALAMVASRFGSTTGTGTISDVELVCDDHIETRSIAVRDFTPAGVPELKAKTVTTLSDLAKQSPADIPALVALIGPAMRDLLNVTANFAKAIERAETLRRESSDVLWWLFGGRSNSLKMPFRSLEQASMPLVLASELSSLTAFVPGFRAAGAFLEAAIHKSGADSTADRTLSQAVKSLPESVIPPLLTSMRTDTVADLTPTLRCIRLRSEFPDERIWMAAAESELGDTLRFQCKAHDLAVQLYSELMLARAIAAGAAE